MPRGNYPDFYPELPGSIVRLKDGIQNKRASSQNGKKIAILGTATDGPVLENVNVDSYENAKSIFGKYYEPNTGVKNGASLMRTLSRVLGAGADNVDLMRISGEEATGEIPMKGIVKEVIHQEREYTTAAGNAETTTDLGIPETETELNYNGVQYDNSMISDVSIFGDGSMLSSTDYKVDQQNGKIEIREGATNSNAELDISYTLTYIKINQIPYEMEVTATNQSLSTTDDLTFTVDDIQDDDNILRLAEDPEDPLVDNPSTEYGDTIQVSEDGTNITDDISSIDYEAGTINFSTQHTGTIDADYVYIALSSEEVPEKTADNEYQLENDDVVPDSEEITMNVIGGSTAVLSDEEYTIDYYTGLITINNMEDYASIEGISYKYRKTTTLDESYLGQANGTLQEIFLNHTADPSKPVLITAAGNELSEEAFDINFNENETSVVYLKPGYAEVNEDIYIKYYWMEEVYTEPAIQAQSPFGGSKYNDVKIQIEPNVVEKNDRYFVPKSGDMLVGDNSDEYLFPNEDTNIKEDTVYIEDNSGSDAELIEGDDYILYPDQGKIEITDSTNVDQPLYTNYAVIKNEPKRATVVRGDFDHTTNEAGEDGGGQYLPIYPEITSDRKTVRLMNDDIVKYYFLNNPDNIVLEDTQADTETSLADTSKSYSIDYGNGVIKFDNALGLNENIKILEYEYYNVANKKVIIHKPEDKYLDSEKNPLVIDDIGPEVTTIGQFINAVNQHERNNNVLRLSVDSEYIAVSALNLKTPEDKLTETGGENPNIIRLTGGKDGTDLTKEEIYEKLEGTEEIPGAYEVLKDAEDVDIVLPAGVFADDELLSGYKNFAQQLADFCSQCFLRNNEIRGIIGTQPLENPTRLNIMEYINEKQELDTDFFMTDENNDHIRDREGNMVDAGKYISVIGYDKVYDDSNLAVPSIESGAADFAAIASMLAPNNSPTNEVTNHGRLAYQISTNQAAKLANNKIVPAKVKNGTPKILDAMTCAQENSGWTRYFTVDIVFDAIDTLRSVFDKYIGKGNTLQRRASLNSDIRDALKKQATLVDFDYSVIMDPSDNSMSRIIIELDLVPAGELQKITTVVSINAQLD